MDKENDILTDGIDERIESFLRGTMSVEEEAAFKQELKVNSELRNRAMTLASLAKGIHVTEARREQNTINSVKKDKKPKRRPILWWACTVAAVFAIFFGINIYKDRRYDMLDTTVSPYYAQYDASEFSRGEIDSVAITHLYSLFNQISQRRDVSDIIKELELIYASLENDYTYYPFANDIMWNLALAYVKDDQIDKAIKLLDKLKNDNPDTPISVKANELLNKLKEM